LNDDEDRGQHKEPWRRTSRGRRRVVVGLRSWVAALALGSLTRSLTAGGGLLGAGGVARDYQKQRGRRRRLLVRATHDRGLGHTKKPPLSPPPGGGGVAASVLTTLRGGASADDLYDERQRSAAHARGLYEKEALYEAYNELHALAKAYQKPFDAPAVVVVGAQSCGKSALVEALMGFQFNEVGGGTRTRRPIGLRMKFDATCDEPRCFVDDERFSKGPREPATLAEVRAFVEAENRRLERDAHRAFDAREISVRVEYRHCPNLVLIDTPGLLAAGPGMTTNSRGRPEPQTGGDSAWRRQASEAYELALAKCRSKDHVLLCVEDSADWDVESVARALCREADPTLARTVIVNTKLDTKLVQFSRKKDILDFLAATALIRRCGPHLLAGPFFTSVPSGRVVSSHAGNNNTGVAKSWSSSSGKAASSSFFPVSPFSSPFFGATPTKGSSGSVDDDDDHLYEDAQDYDFEDDADYRAAVERAASADASLVASRLGRAAFDALSPRLGVAALRKFLETHVEATYRANVARVLPLLRAERQTALGRIRETKAELEQLSPQKLRRSADAVADAFCRNLERAVAGAVSAPPTDYGESLADERVRAGAFLKMGDVLGDPPNGLPTTADVPPPTGAPQPGSPASHQSKERATASASPRRRGAKFLAGGFSTSAATSTTLDLKTAQSELDRRVGHAEARLYGGAQYRRTLREFSLAVRRSALPAVEQDEVANALGVGDAHDGADFVRAACVIAVEKARQSFEPQLDALATRVGHVMRRLPPAVVHMMRARSRENLNLAAASSSSSASGGRASMAALDDAFVNGGALGATATTPGDAGFSALSSPPDVFLGLVTRAYDAYAADVAEHAANRCRDDLAAMTRFVTWDLAAAHTDAVAALASHLPRADLETPVDYSSSGLDDHDEEARVLEEWKAASEGGPIEDHAPQGRRRRRRRHHDDDVLHNTNTADDGDEQAYDASTAELIDVLHSASAEEIHHAESSVHAHALVTDLVKRIAGAWREHFARTVAVKFNCFFLMPFVDEFPLVLRKHLDDLFDTTDFDLDKARKALQLKLARLEQELVANQRLHDTFEAIQRLATTPAAGFATTTTRHQQHGPGPALGLGVPGAASADATTGDAAPTTPSR